MSTFLIIKLVDIVRFSFFFNFFLPRVGQSGCDGERVKITSTIPFNQINISCTPTSLLATPIEEYPQPPFTNFWIRQCIHTSTLHTHTYIIHTIHIHYLQYTYTTYNTHTLLTIHIIDISRHRHIPYFLDYSAPSNRPRTLPRPQSYTARPRIDHARKIELTIFTKFM